MARRKFDTSLIPPSPDLTHETALWNQGFQRTGGIDEAGRGALAGPVFAAVVVLPADPSIQDALSGVRDSKQMTATARAHWRERIQDVAVDWAVGSASAAEIDAIGILPATRLAIRKALLQIDPLPDHLLIDHIRLPEVPIPQTSLVKGDARCLSIAAASVLAKTARDDHMRVLARRFPGYDWERNKGYGTQAHLAAIASNGRSDEHRKTFLTRKERASNPR